MTFHVGQKVVCVNDKKGIFRASWVKYASSGLAWPRKGQIYTVEEIGTALEGHAMLVLAEIERDGQIGFSNRGFAAARFRPVVERKTDISQFTAMLTSKPQKVTA